VSEKIRAVIQALVLWSLMASFCGAHAYEDTSPVQIFDIQNWIQIRDRAAASREVTSLKRLVEIIYDRIISRPREEADYWREAGKRWGDFRRAYCPSDLSLCALPQELGGVRQLAAIRDGLVDAQARKLLNERLGPQGLRLSPTLIFPGQLPAAGSDKANFSFRITTIEDEQSSNVDGTSLVTMGDVILNDLLTYHMSFGSDLARTYFAVDSRGNGYVQADRVRESAYSFAVNWKKVAQKKVNYSTIDVGDLLLQQLKKELNGAFDATFDRLLARLDAGNPDHLEHIDRFRAERARDRYPTEVYQWVIYDQLLQISSLLTEHYQQVKVNGDDVHSVTQALKGIVALQKQISPRLLFCLLQREWDLDEGAVVEQVLTRPVAGLYMAEHVQVLLEHGPYAKFAQFEKLSAKIDYRLLTDDREFLEAQNPGFYRKMSVLGLLDAEKLRAAPLALQKAWLENYVTKDGQAFALGVYRVSAALTLSLDARSARDLAEIIRQAPLSKTGDGISSTFVSG
jgi:hypothetical protein